MTNEERKKKMDSIIDRMGMYTKQVANIKVPYSDSDKIKMNKLMDLCEKLQEKYDELYKQRE